MESRLDGRCKATSSCQHIGDEKAAQGDLPPTISHLHPAFRASELLRHMHRRRLRYCGSSPGKAPQPPDLHCFYCRHVSQLSPPGRQRYVSLCWRDNLAGWNSSCKWTLRRRRDEIGVDKYRYLCSGYFLLLSQVPQLKRGSFQLTCCVFLHISRHEFTKMLEKFPVSEFILTY